MAKFTEKQEILSDLEKRVKDKILEQSNSDLLKKLVEKADTLDEAIKIAELGTTYKLTGFHFDKRLDKESNTISYFKKNNELSFKTDPKAKTHKLIVGDNYPALLNLLVEYKGKIDVIYIDPPYGKDNMGEFAETNYDNAITRDNLLSMLYPRLMVAKLLLSESGVIFCSIDDRNQAYVKCLFDEVFGEGNFVGNFIRKTKSMTGDEGAGVNIQHEYMICFAKYKINLFLQGDEKTFDSYKNPDNDPNGDWTSGDPSAKSGGDTTYFSIKNPFTGKEDFPPKGRFWSFSKETREKYIEKGKIKFKENYRDNERGFIFKRYKNELGTSYNPVNSLDLTKNDYMNSIGTVELNNLIGYNVFDNPKPVSLVKKCVSTIPNKSTIVLDFFAGSGTAGQAVLELNKEDNGSRQFILVTNNEKTDKTPNGIAVDVTSKRLKRVMTGKCYDGTNNFEWAKKNKPLGDNLEVLDIAEVSNFEAVPGKTAFDVIDETLYGNKKFATVKEKTQWVCDNFEITQKKSETDEEWKKRKEKGE
jgi:adenine-specific DNA-methyltransferase